MQYILIYLTCKDTVEANKIRTSLLEKKLVACTKITPVESKYLWEGEIAEEQEVLLLLETTEEKFDQIESAVKALHSYTQIVMFAVPMIKTAKGMSEWIDQETINV